MTYSITDKEVENGGSVTRIFATVDITSLDSAGFEPFDPAAQFNLDDPNHYGVSVRGLENPQYRVAYDHINAQLDVINVSDGADVTSTTDVGEVVVEVVGR